jgi:hypothetical protein
MALLFSPSESSHIAQVESLDGKPMSGLGMFLRNELSRMNVEKTIQSKRTHQLVKLRLLQSLQSSSSQNENGSFQKPQGERTYDLACIMEPA